MHEHERNRLLKRRRAVLLAAVDMDHAEAAARALDAETEDVHLMRALEAAMAVSYMRAFTSSTLLTLKEFVPSEEPAASLHSFLDRLRDKLYAHTDKDGGRSASMEVTAMIGGMETNWQLGMQWQEEWPAFPRDAIPAVIALFNWQRDRLRQEAAEITLQLEDLVVGQPNDFLRPLPSEDDHAPGFEAYVVDRGEPESAS